MKFRFTPPNDGQTHVYCLGCSREMGQATIRKKNYRCQACGCDSPRALIIDPKVEWYQEADGEYCHKTAGVFLTNSRGEFLFFERTNYPSGLTVPAGHKEIDEDALTAALRELAEEVGVALQPHQLVPIANETIRGDGCRRGADVHDWHVFAAQLPRFAKIKVNKDEGKRPVWLTPRQALGRPLTFATRHLITRILK